MANNTPEDIPQTPPPSIPLHMSGFLAGNTIHVQGDAGNVHFSGQFDIHQQHNTHQQSHFPGTDSPESSPQMSILSMERLFSSITQNKTTHGLFDDHPPITNTTDPSSPVGKNHHPIEFPDLGRSDFDQGPEDCGISATQMCDMDHVAVTTRLRSGVISPVSYFSRRNYGYVGECCDKEGENWSRRSNCRKGGSIDRGDVLERVLRRHSFPVRPCNSYSFFVMAKWRDVSIRSSSFQETSKRLGDMWSQLPQNEKKEFVEMAFKDNDRYKRQCILLKRKDKRRLGGQQ